jgi:hypothetical protein
MTNYQHWLVKKLFSPTLPFMDKDIRQTFWVHNYLLEERKIETFLLSHDERGEEDKVRKERDND